MISQFQQRLHEIGTGDHVCLVYEEPSEQMATIVPFIKVGLERNERCVYIADDQTIDQVRRVLADTGVGVEPEMARGALSLVTKREAYLRLGSFDPDQMIVFLRETTSSTRAAGYSALRIAGEMTWALGPETGCDRLVEYEVALNRFFPESDALAVCQYNRNRFSPSIIRDVLRTHPIAILGETICSNVYYEPPDAIINGVDDAVRVEWMIRQLRSAREAEERLLQQAQDLARSNADLQQFAYVTSHDLQEPLRTMGIFAQLLARKYGDGLDEEAKSIIHSIVESAERMRMLIRDLLAYSDVTAVSDAHHRTVEMNTVFDTAMNNLTTEISKRGATVTRDELPPVYGGVSQLLMLLQNLIDNAIKYNDGERPPHVHMTARSDGAHWVFSVSDNGVGIPAKYQAQIFGIFKRLSRTVAGTGIGLALCQRIVERHNGRIWVDSEPGKGSIFHFTIPR